MSKKAKKPTMELETILHGDLVYEIFLRLPVKSLARFKCISKHWETLISSRRFTKALLERYPEPNITLFLCGNIRRIEFAHYMAVVTYHGLICISNFVTGDAYVWNPVTNQLRTFKSQCPDFFPFVGFGYDTINDDYKVVKITRMFDEAYLTIEICELRNTETRVIHLPSNQVPFWLSNARPVTVNGSSHWIAFHPEKNILQIVRFDMDHEKFVEIPFSTDMPNIKSDVHVDVDVDAYLRRIDTGLTLNNNNFSLGVVGGSLCLFINNLLRTEAWSMNCKNHDGSDVVWTRLFEIPLSHKPDEVVVIGSTANDEVVFRYKKNNFAYDPWREKYFHLKPSHYHLDDMSHVVAYVESLVNVLPQ